MPVETSAAKALGSRAKMEYKAGVAVARQSAEFFAAVYRMALRDRQYLSAGAVSVLWADLMRPEALTGVPDDLAASLSTALLESSLPSRTYDSAMAVLATSAEQGWDDNALEQALFYTLHPDTGSMQLASDAPPSLTAATPVREVIKDLPGKGFVQAIKTPLRKPLPLKLKIAARNALNEYGYVWAAILTEMATTKVTEWQAKRQEAGMVEEGFPTKMWVTRRDDRVREAHAEADYQTVPVGQPFIVGGYAMMFPGDSAAPIHLTANCRCVIIPGAS